MTKLSFELDEAAEAEIYNIVNYYKQFDLFTDRCYPIFI